MLELAPDTTVDVLESVRLAAQGDLDGAVAASTAEFMPWLEERDVPPDGWLAQQRRRWTETYVDLLRRAAADAEAADEVWRRADRSSSMVASTGRPDQGLPGDADDGPDVRIGEVSQETGAGQAVHTSRPPRP